MYTVKKLVICIAIASAFPAACMAQAAPSQKSEIEALKKQVKELQAMMQKITLQNSQSSAQSAETSAQVLSILESSKQAIQADKSNVVDVTEFNRIRVKTEAMDEAIEANGFRALKISGYIDPTYVYNRNGKTSSFVFFNNNSSINGSNESFGYDNSSFGSGMFNMEKELDGGTKFKLTLMPSKSSASSNNFGNLVHEASVSIPLYEPATRLIAGQLPDWTGYEAIPAPQNKLITHNLLFDFSAASFYTGAGVDLLRGAWDSKIMIGNMNRARVDVAKQQIPGVFYRVDYTQDEFNSFGFSGIHSGFDDKLDSGRLDLVEIDGSLTRGDWNFQAQLSYGRQSATPANAYLNERQHWYGLSSLASYKVSPRLDATARFDYINNARHGGGLFGSTFGGVCKDSTGADASCPDGRNGFGSNMSYDGSNWIVSNPDRGSNRSALSLGLSYALLTGVSIKGEYRFDHSNAHVFKTADEQYTQSNHLFALSTVISF
ncbi:DUF3138 family protein [Undibacterium sp.]|uniref:DUF3138 family protein n=1 Tax=Undibacterium sp. TaxID=1914977 RepID=UPI0025D09561|nr:DUF3138 family protein [Undibacterium sp.]